MFHTDLKAVDVAAHGRPAQEERRWRAMWQGACGPRAGGAPSGKEATWAPVWGATYAEQRGGKRANRGRPLLYLSASLPFF